MHAGVPFFICEDGERMSLKIERIEITHHQLPLDPPFPASWDAQPRRKFPATIVRVYDSDGRMGVGSGDAMYGFEDYQHFFIGRDPLDLDKHHRVMENVCFTAGRPWPLSIALYDLAGKIKGLPCWKMCGGFTDTVAMYCSSGVHRPPEAMGDMALHARERGFKAFKVRFGRSSLKEDVKALEAIRMAVGDKMELMVDCNQGWRMNNDIQVPWDVQHALQVAAALKELDVFWMEEPLHRGDYMGMNALRRKSGIRIAGGELTREPYEFDQLLENQCLDVYQPDVAFTLGIEGMVGLAKKVKRKGLIFSPHTWGNGIGFTANLHVVAGATGTPFLEYPYDPPEWSVERRDFMLTEPVAIDRNGCIKLTNMPGLGIALDEDRLNATRSTRLTYV